MPVPTRRPGDELDILEQHAFRRADDSIVAASFDAATRARAEHFARLAPWLSPGVLLPLARGGADPALVRTTAVLEAQRIAERPAPYGSQIRAGVLQPGDPRLFRAVLAGQQQAYVRSLEQRHAEGELDRLGLVRDGRLTAPVNMASLISDGKFDVDAVRRLDPDKVEAVDVLIDRILPNAETNADGYVEFVTADGQVMLYNPSSRTVRGDPTRNFESVDPLADMARYALMAMDAPTQELQGLIRSGVSALPGGAPPRAPQWQSNLAIAMTRPDLDSGDGVFFDDSSTVARERRRREEQYGQVGGHNITAGRWVTDTVLPFSIDSKPYQFFSGTIDAGVALLDPTLIAGEASASARASARLFSAGDEAVSATARGARTVTELTDEAAGLLRGSFVDGVHGPTAAAWLDGTEGTRVVRAIAAESSPTAIWRASNQRLTPADAARLADASTPEAVREVITPHLGPTFRSPDDVWRSGWRDAIPGRSPAVRRLMARVPGPMIDTFDPQSAMRELDAVMTNARIPRAEADEILDRLARGTGRNAQFAVATETMATVRAALVANGAAPEVASRWTRLFQETHRDAQHWFVDEVGDDVPVWTSVAAGDDTIEGFGPHLMLEHLNRYIPLPDPRAIRRLTTKYPRFFTPMRPSQVGRQGEPTVPALAVQHLQDTLWKPFALLRLAWPIRVVGEEQLRMAAAGYDSMFRHPISFVAHSLWRAGDTDALGTPLGEAEEFTKAMTRRAGGWVNDNPHRVRTSMATVWHRTDDEMPEFVDAWAGEITRLRHDPVARTVAQSDSLDAAEEWFTRGAGREFFDELADARPELASAGGARRYLETVSERITVKTGGNADLLDAVRTGKLDGKNILDSAEIAPTNELKAGLRSRLDSAPDAVRGEHWALAQQSGTLGTWWRNTTNVMFGYLMGVPTNRLSRSAVFKQEYWREVTRLVAFGDADARARLVAGARAAGLGRRPVRKIEHVAARGALSADEVDVLAKGHALETVKSLLYDMSERNQLMDGLRLVAPFGEAWKEVMTRWARLAYANPFFARRAQLAVKGAQGEEFGDVMGAPEGEGFFWRNEFGDIVFNYPGSSWLNSHDLKIPSSVPVVGGMGLPGEPVPLVGSAEGLSMMGDVLPGLGPVAGVTVGALAPDNKGWQRTLKNQLLPYGWTGEQESGAIANVFNYAPPWMRRGIQALTGGGFDQRTNRIYANTIMDAAAYLSSTGRFDTTTREGQQALMEQAEQLAQNVFLVRSFASFGAPSAPRPEFLLDTKNDGLIRLALARDDYHVMVTEEGGDQRAATARFIDKYGWDAGLAPQPHSRTITGGVQPTLSFSDWEKANEGLARDLPNIYAYFGPQEGEFDYGVYLDQLRSGAREGLTTDEWLKLATTHRANILVADAEAMLPENPTAEDRAWLAEHNRRVRQENPGFGDYAGLEQRADRETLFAELGQAAVDRRVLDTDAGAGLAEYWKARAQVMDVEGATTPSGNLSTSQATAADRQWLAGYGEALARENEAFAPLWNFVLKNELRIED